PLVGGRQVLREGLPHLPAGAPLVDEVVVCDAEQPRLQVRAGPESGQAGERLEKRLLGQVLGSVLVVRQVIEPAVQAGPVTPGERRERRPVALLGRADQGLFVVARHGSGRRFHTGTTRAAAVRWRPAGFFRRAGRTGRGTPPPSSNPARAARQAGK